MPVCLRDNDKNLGERVLLGTLSKTEQIQMYLQQSEHYKFETFPMVEYTGLGKNSRRLWRYKALRSPQKYDDR